MPLADAQTVLSAQDVVVDFSARRGTPLRAVDHASFELRAGQVLGVVGESGSGKSTLGRVVAGFLKPNSGRVLYPAGDSGLRPRAQRRPRGYRDVQMIFQESAAALDPRLPVWRVVGEAIVPSQATSLAVGGRRSELRARVSEQLDRVGLPAEQFLDKRSGELSGGEKQRVAIARALSSNPVAMVCDESVSALDVSIRAVVLNLFKKLSIDSRIALFFITHDISVVAYLADYIVVMHHGRIVEQGPAGKVIDEPADEYTRKLIGAVPTLERTLRR